MNKNIIKLQNKYLGKRCFVIGNGPSLSQMDLTKLKDEYTFVSNMFHLHQKCKDINPSFYTISDWIHWENNKFIHSMEKEFPKLKDTTFFFEERAIPAYKNSFSQDLLKKAYFIKLNDYTYVWENNFSINIDQSVNWARSVVLDFSIPIAIFMGFKEIILIGCDFNHCDNLKKKENPWFYNNKKPIKYTNAHLKLMHDPEHLNLTLKCIDIIKQYTDENTIKLVNATIGGNIMNLPRVNYDELF